MNRETPSSSSSSSSGQTPFNYQQNQPVTYTPSNYINGFNIQQFPNNNINHYYNIAAINNPYLYNNIVNEYYNNGYMAPVNVPRINLHFLYNPLNYNLNNNSYLEPSQPSYSSYYDTNTSQLPNVNGDFSNGSLSNASNTNFNNKYMQSSSNNIRFNTPTMPPLHVNIVNSSPTTIDKPPVNRLNNGYVVSKIYETKKECQELEDWFDLTSKFLNNLSNNYSTNSDSKTTSNRSQFPKHRSYRKSQNINMNTNKTLIAENKKSSCMTIQQIVNYEKEKCYQLSPTNVYFKTEENSKIVLGEKSTLDTCDEFNRVLVKRALEMNALKPTYNVPHKNNAKVNKKCSDNHYSDDSSSDEYTITRLEVLKSKMAHPDRLHPDLWYNELGEMNDGPLCKCSIRSQRSGIRHNIYVGEGPFEPCLPNSNNADKLFHYRIIITPPTHFLFKCPTIIEKDGKEFVFEGFSLLSHYGIPTLPTCKVIRFNTNYTISYIEDKIPENFVINELQLFYDYLFKDILELVDLDLHAFGNKDGCPQFHFMPRFVRELSVCNKELLSMNDVLKYLLTNNKLLFEENSLVALKNMSMDEWENTIDEYRGMIVTNPRTKPHSIRVDQLDRDNVSGTSEQIENDGYPVLVHFGIQPPQLSYAQNPKYLKERHDYIKFEKLLADMPKQSFKDTRKLEIIKTALQKKLNQKIKSQNENIRGVTRVVVSSKGFYKTGLMCDIVQHAMLLPILVGHLRFHKSLEHLQDTLNYKFKNRYLLQLALTHASYQDNFGTNPDHARNTLSNCGIKKPNYGGGRINSMSTKKKGLDTLINIMSRCGKENETESNIMRNERLEFLGDAVVEFVSSIHLFNLFPDIQEGELSIYRTAIVENIHLTFLAKTLKLDDYLLYAHSIYLCYDSEFNRAMADCFEALMGALFLDGGIDVADRVFGEIFFRDSPKLLDIWVNYPKHPLQEQEPEGDRKWIETTPFLKKLTKFEDSIGIKFKHIKLLARALTDRSVGFTNLTLGSNQRLEFLGDTVLKLVVSDHLYRFYPDHHEGHLSLLLSSLVSNKTQSIICDELGMVNYVCKANGKAKLSTKDRADLVEAFLGALYIDKGLKHCEAFCSVCFFPRLPDIISKQNWNDPKSKLQQCCLTLKSIDEGEPHTPVYRVIGRTGTPHNGTYKVAVYFKGVRLARGNDNARQRAEMNAANNALEMAKDIFPQLNHQRRAIARRLKNQCSDGQADIKDIINKLVESNTLKSESSMSNSELAKRKLHRKLLAVLCLNKTIENDDDDEDDDDVDDDKDYDGDDDGHDDVDDEDDDGHDDDDDDDDDDVDDDKDYDGDDDVDDEDDDGHDDDDDDDDDDVDDDDDDDDDDRHGDIVDILNKKKSQ